MKRLLELGLCNGVLAYPRFIASYTLPVRQYRILQSRCLQCIPHDKPPCDLLMLQGITLAHKGLAPSGKTHPILRYLEKKFVFFFELFNELQTGCALLMQGTHMDFKLGTACHIKSFLSLKQGA